MFSGFAGSFSALASSMAAHAMSRAASGWRRKLPLTSIDRALSVRAAARFASARDWLAALDGAPVTAKPVVVVRSPMGPVVPNRPRRGEGLACPTEV